MYHIDVINHAWKATSEENRRSFLKVRFRDSRLEARQTVSFFTADGGAEERLVSNEGGLTSESHPAYETWKENLEFLKHAYIMKQASAPGECKAVTGAAVNVEDLDFNKL